METISVDQEYDASEYRVFSVLRDVTGFFDVAGSFVARIGNQLKLSELMAMTQFELQAKLHETELVVLAYEQISNPSI